MEKTSKQKQQIEKKERPVIVSGRTIRVRSGCGNLYISINEDEKGQPIECIAVLSKSGSCARCHIESSTRAISLGLKYSVPLSEFYLELRGIRCPSPVAGEDGALSCADAIARAIQNYLKSKNKSVVP